LRWEKFFKRKGSIQHESAFFFRTQSPLSKKREAEEHYFNARTSYNQAVADYETAKNAYIEAQGNQSAALIACDKAWSDCINAFPKNSPSSEENQEFYEKCLRLWKEACIKKMAAEQDYSTTDANQTKAANALRLTQNRRDILNREFELAACKLENFCKTINMITATSLIKAEEAYLRVQANSSNVARIICQVLQNPVRI
jgi:hypothetical protein